MNYTCIICNDIEKKIIKKGVRDNNSINVVKCLKCGHVQLDLIPDLEEDKYFYDKDMQSRELNKDIDFAKKRENYALDLESRKKIFSQISKDSNILEIGSGYGFLLEYMINAGYKIEGLEISSYRRKLSNSISSANVYDYNILKDEVPLEMNKRYDVIIMLQMLEHISNPKKFLIKVREMLKDGGIAIIEVPNFNDHMIKVCKEYFEFYFQRAHISYFTPDTLKYLIEESGFSTVDIKGIQRYSIANAINWFKNGKPEIKDPTFDLPIHIKWVEDYYKSNLSKDIKSDTILAICRK